MTPHLDIERQLVGAILIRPDILDEVRSICDPTDVVGELWRRSYARALELRAGGHQIDMLAIAEGIRGTEMVSAVASLSEAMRATATSEQGLTAARIIRQRSVGRAVRSVCVQLLERAGEDADPFELLREAESRLAELSRRQAPGRARRIADILPEVLESIENAAIAFEKGETVTGIPTGFAALDRRTGGLIDSNVYILAARPGQGKTALKLQLMRAAAEAGYPPLTVSLEMGDIQLLKRMLSTESGIPVTNLIRGHVERVQVQHLAGSIAKTLSSLPIYIDDGDSSDLDDIVTRIRRYVREDGVRVVFVDFLQLVRTRAASRANEVDTVARTFKNLARSLNIPIVLLSQLNRQLENRPSKRPHLADLKESGGIEEAADLVWFLYRPHAYDKNDDHWDAKTGTAHAESYSEIITAKFRNGECGTDALSWDGPRTRFLEPFIASEMNGTPSGWEPAEESF